MSENYIHIDNIVEDRATRPGQIGMGANITTRLDGVSKIAVVGLLSQLLDDLEIPPSMFMLFRDNFEEDIVRSDSLVLHCLPTDQHTEGGA